MKCILAELTRLETAERRNAVRWHVELITSAASSGNALRALVRNLSESGMMIETDKRLRVDEIIVVELPGAELTEARVVWQQNTSFGCEFLKPISTPVISAVLLKAPPYTPADGNREPQYEEFPIAIGPTIDELADWKAHFNGTWGKQGYRVIAYRQTCSGLMIAIAARTAGAARNGRGYNPPCR